MRRSICTSEALRTSTRVSPGIARPRHRSPSFGYQYMRSNSSTEVPKPVLRRPTTSAPDHTNVHALTRTHHFHFASRAYSRLSDLRIHQTPWSVFQDGSSERLSLIPPSRPGAACRSTQHPSATAYAVKVTGLNSLPKLRRRAITREGRQAANTLPSLRPWTSRNPGKDAA